MLKLLFFGLMISQLCLGASEQKAAPEFSFLSQSGAHFKLSQLKGKVIVIRFFATWCATCKQEIPLLNNYYRLHKKDGLLVLGVSVDQAKDYNKLKEWSREFDFPVALLKDTDFKFYGRIWRLPLSFVIDRKGILKKDGWVTDNSLSPAEIANVLDPLL